MSEVACLLAMMITAFGLLCAIGSDIETRLRSRWVNNHVARLLAEFEAEGRTVRIPPIEVTYYGSTSGRKDTAFTSGGFLCVIDSELLATGYYVDRWDIHIPLDAIRWIGTSIISTKITVTRGSFTRVIRKRALIVSCDSCGGWPAYAWTSPRQKVLGMKLAELCQLPFYDLGGEEKDLPMTSR
jgi:hypothetical protein